MENSEAGLKVLKGKEGIPVGRPIVVATNFLYTDYRRLARGEQRADADTIGIRGDLALDLLDRAIRLGVRVVAADGGSSADFLSVLGQFKNSGFTLVPSDVPGRAPQRRSAFEVATALTGGKVIVYAQPEKGSIMDHLAEISKPIVEGNADIVVPRRNPKLFKQSYPDYMRRSELRVNAIYDRLMRGAGRMRKEESFDWFFGPVVFRNSPEIVTLFLKRYERTEAIKSRIEADPNPEKHSGSHYFPIIQALFEGKRVVSVEVPFVYPESQRRNETSPEAIKSFMRRRKIDAAAYLLEAIHFIAFLKEDPRSKIRQVPV